MKKVQDKLHAVRLTPATEADNTTQPATPQPFAGSVDTWDDKGVARLERRCVTSMEGKSFSLPTKLANHLIVKSNHNVSVTGDKIYLRGDDTINVFISRRDLTLIAEHFLYGIIPPLDGTRAEQLRRIAQAYDLPLLGAALGDSTARKKADALAEQAANRAALVQKMEDQLAGNPELKALVEKSGWRELDKLPRSVDLRVLDSLPIALYDNDVTSLSYGYAHVPYERWLDGLRTSDHVMAHTNEQVVTDLKRWAKLANWQVKPVICVTKKSNPQTQGFLANLVAPTVVASNPANVSLFTTKHARIDFERCSNG